MGEIEGGKGEGENEEKGGLSRWVDEWMLCTANTEEGSCVGYY